MQETTTAVPWFVWVNLAEVAVLVVTAVLVWRELSSTHDWNRRKTTHDLLSQLMIGPVTEMRRSLDGKIHPYERGRTYTDDAPTLNEADRTKLRTILNYFEEMSLGIKHNIIDGDIAYDCCATMVVTFHRWAAPFIAEERDASDSFWIEFEHTAVEWSKKMEDEARERRRPGKRKLGAIASG